MNSPVIRVDTDHFVTLEQIGRLERGLLSMRTRSEGDPRNLEAIAAVQYQEIVRLRAELDAAMGFEEKEYDVVASLAGPTIHFGVAPASAIAGFLTGFRTAIQSITAYLKTGELSSRGRLPEDISRQSDLQLAGIATGSVQLKFNLPEPQSLFPDYEKEPVEHSIRLMLEAVEWIASTKGVEELHHRVNDQQLARLLLSQANRVAPSRRGIISRVEFSGRFADPEVSYVLSLNSTRRIRDAFGPATPRSVSVTETGKLRSVDLDSGRFALRQRPDDEPDLLCFVPRQIVNQAVGFLVDDAAVLVIGTLEYDKRGRPSQLAVEEIYEFEED